MCWTTVVVGLNVLGYKITGYPVRIDNTKYARNAYYFNLCFVCDSWARTVQYEPVVKKLSEYLFAASYFRLSGKSDGTIIGTTMAWSTVDWRDFGRRLLD
uniref:Uncharacterized protein n=1 Tax=Timema genevievae TaxID=629358 RepID=A0A7R9K124_TIMGE|nr:unnamed protein product [Timema genevievae]